MTAAYPRLRTDLVIRRQETGDGSAFVVKAPATGRFFRLGEAEQFITRQLDGSTSLDLVRERVAREFGAPLTEATLARFVDTLHHLGLLETGGTEHQTPAPRRLLGSLLYLRLRAFDPDRLFDRLVVHLGWLFTPASVASSGALVLLGAAIVAANGSAIARDLGQLYRVDAIVLAWLTLLSVTAVHEFAHGLACKRFGGRVHELGFMLLYFQPAMYCNVSDAWLFPERSKRLGVTFAGAWVELVLWALAALVWRVTDAGTTPRYVALVVMFTSGVKTLFNLNPLIKLDGYYLLSDYLEVPNLRQRAFAHLGALLRGQRDRGRGATPRERRIYLVYGVLAGAFSLWVLGLVIAWTGRFLTGRYQAWGFAAFVALLLAVFRRPLGRALTFLGPGVSMGTSMRGRRRLVAVTALLGAAVAFSVLGHMDLRVAGEFTVLPAHNADVRAEVDGIISDVYVKEGDVVGKGDPIARLSDRDHRAELEKTRAEIAARQATHRLAVAGPRPQEVELARTTVEKATEQLKYARHHFDRVASLHRQQLSSQKDYEEAEEAVAVREKELEEAEGRLRVLLAGTRAEEIEAIRADLERLEAHERHLEDERGRLQALSPIAGVITTPKLDERVGQYVHRGDLIAEVHELGTVSAEIAVPEKEISDVRAGQAVVLKARAFPDVRFEGKVTSISPTVSAPPEGLFERTVTVVTELDNRSLLLKPRMTGHAKISCGPRRIADLLTRRLSRYLRVEFWSWW
jgi:multidrug resistance efflux pump